MTYKTKWHKQLKQNLQDSVVRNLVNKFLLVFLEQTMNTNAERN